MDTMRTSDERILTTHVGSLPRPDDVIELLNRRAEGEAIDESELATAAEAARREVIRRQDDVGIDVVNDGEQARVGYNVYLRDRLDGFGDREVTRKLWSDVKEFPGFAERAYEGTELDPQDRPAAVGPIAYDPARAERELASFGTLLEELDVDPVETFVTAASPGVATQTLRNRYYDTDEAYLEAMTEALRQEYELVAASGSVLQIDATDMLGYRHRHYQDRSLDEFKDRVRRHVRAINEATRNVDAEQIRLHACWGNYQGPHTHDVPLEEILPLLYDLDVGGLLLEQAQPRHQQEFRAFAEHPLPDDWVVVPGVIDVKTNVVEHPETVADRIERVADAVGDPTRVLAAPDCGFGTLVGWHTVEREIVWEKLAAMVEGAAIATDRLF